MGISSLGIGSGLDLKTLLEGIKEGQKERLTPIIKQKKSLDAKVSAYGQLKSAMSEFSAATKELQNPDIFNSRVVTNDSDSFTATAHSGAALGNYSVKIDQLASSHSVATNIISTDTPLVSGDDSPTITIEQVNGTKLTVSLGNKIKSLHDIANAINNATITNENGISNPSTMNTTVVRSNSDQYQLIISSKESGEANSIMSIDSSDLVLDNLISFDMNDENNSAMTQTLVGQNAKFNLNGISITSPSNTITNVIDGIDITLKNTSSSKESMVVEANNQDAKDTIKGWVDSFNKLKSTIDFITRFTPSDKSNPGQNNNNGPLLGDSIVRDAENRIRSVLSGGQSGKFTVLSDLGITMEPSTGSLILNENKLQTALSNDSDAVSKFFIGDGKTTGFANQVVAETDRYTENRGRIQIAEGGLASRLKTLGERYDQINDGIEQSIDRYRTKFNKLDALKSSLSATTNYLNKQL